jgi:hypothetical protein
MILIYIKKKKKKKYISKKKKKKKKKGANRPELNLNGFLKPSKIDSGQFG